MWTSVFVETGTNRDRRRGVATSHWCQFNVNECVCKTNGPTGIVGEVWLRAIGVRGWCVADNRDESTD